MSDLSVYLSFPQIGIIPFGPAVDLIENLMKRLTTMCDHHFASNVILVTIIFRGHVSVEEQLKSRVFELMKMLVSIKPANIFRISIYRHNSFYNEPTLLINSHVCS